MIRSSLALLLALASVAHAADNAIPRIELAADAALPADLPAGNLTLHLPADNAIPRDATVTAIDAAGTRITAPLSRQIHLHLDAPLRALEWTPTPPAGPVSLETHAPYEPRIALRHDDRQPLPLVLPGETESIDFTLVGDLPAGSASPSLPLLPHCAALAVVTSWDDGHVNDLRLARLLAEHGYAGTFFMNQFSHARRRDLAALEALGMEIGSHTINHPRGWTMPPDAWLVECLHMRLGLEADLGHPVVSFAYPYNHTPAYDPNGDYVLRAVRASGYESARTTRTRGEAIDGYPEPLSHSTDGHFLMPAERMEQAWRRAAGQPGGVFNFWGHSSEIRTPEAWENVAATLARHARHPDAWYATQGQLFLWRWLRAHARIEPLASDNGTRFRLTFPRLDPHWRKQLPISLRLPPGTLGVMVNDLRYPLPDDTDTVTLPSP